MSHAVTLVPKGMEQPSIDIEMEAFMAQVQQVQSLADIAAMSGVDHIARLHRPGAKYFNMCASAAPAHGGAALTPYSCKAACAGTRSRCSA
jgi:hypothetical protein